MKLSFAKELIGLPVAEAETLAAEFGYKLDVTSINYDGGHCSVFGPLQISGPDGVVTTGGVDVQAYNGTVVKVGPRGVSTLDPTLSFLSDSELETIIEHWDKLAIVQLPDFIAELDRRRMRKEQDESDDAVSAVLAQIRRQ